MKKFLSLGALLGLALGWTAHLLTQPEKSSAPQSASRTGSSGAVAGQDSPASATPTVPPQSAKSVDGDAPERPPVSVSPSGKPPEWDRFAEWLKRWRAASADGKAALEEEGVKLAEERVEVLYGLIQSSPKKAFELGVPLNEYVDLPPSVQARMEKPFNTQTSFEVLRAMSVNEKGVCAPGAPMAGEIDTPNGRVVVRTGNDEAAETYTYGARLAGYPGKEETTVHGYALNGRQIIGENSLQRLAVEDINAAVTLFGESEFGRTMSPVSGLPVDPTIAAVYGGRVHWFASSKELGQAEALLRAIDTSVNPKPITRYFDRMTLSGIARGSTTELITPETYEPLVAFSFSSYSRAWTCAPKKVFVAAIKYTQDGWDTTKYIPKLQGITSGVDKFIQDISRGQSQFTVVMPTTAITCDKVQHPNESTALLNKLKDYYQNTMGGNPNDIDIWTSFVETTNGSAGYAGRGLAGAWRCWITDCTGQGLWCHEYGHCYGLPHANSWLLNAGVTNPLSALGAHKEYGDQLDVMGSGTYPQGYWRMQALWAIGWRDDSEYPEITSPGVYNVYRYDAPSMGLAEKTAGNPLPQGMRIRRNGVSNELFSIANRSNYTYLPTIGRGLQVVRITENGTPGWYDSSQSHMLDLTPETRDDNSDGGLPVGKTFCDTEGGVSVTPLSLKGTAPNIYFETEVKFGPFTGNHAPTGLALSVPSAGAARTAIAMSASATDSDGDSLAYHWDFGDGTFATSATATQSKIYNAGGTYAVKVSVSDKKGGSATATANITVSDPIRTLSTQTMPGSQGGYIRRVRALKDTGVFVLGSYGGIFKSSNGSTWTKLSITGASGYTLWDIARNESTIVVLANSDADNSVKLFFSNDEGATWSSFTPSAAATLSKLTWTGSNFIAAAGNASNPYVLISSNGITWSKVNVSIPTGGSWKGIATDGEGNVLMSGVQSAIAFTAFSTDHGATWTTNSADMNASGDDCAFFKGDFYLGGWNMNVSKVTGSGKVITSMGQVKETRSGDFFFDSNPSFAVARQSKTSTTTNLQLTRNGTEWSSVNLEGNPYMVSAAYYGGYLFMVQRDIDSQGYAVYKVMRTTNSVADSFVDSQPPSDGSPVITTQPLSKTVTVGASVSFSVVATGTNPLSYQWRKNSEAIDGATSANLTISSVGSNDAGSYDVVVTNSVGSVTSDAATLRVNTPVTITQQPASTTVNIGASFSLQVTATGTTPITYQWKKGGVSIAGATASTYSVASALATHAGAYTVVVTNPAGSVTSSVATVGVNGPPVITTQPVGGAFAAGASLTLSVSVSGTAPFTYQWYKDNAAISGATASSFNIASLQSSNAGSYKVTVTNSVSSVTSSAAIVSVNTPVTITTQPAGVTVNQGASFTLQVVATGTAPLTYQWKKDGTNISGATAASYAVGSATASHGGSYTVVVSNPVGSVTSNAATVAVRTAPAITSQPVGGAFNLGSSMTLSVTATGTAPFTYQWYKNAAPISGATSSTYTIAALQTSDAAAYKVTVTNSAGSVTSSTVTVSITIGPAITTQPASKQVTAGSSVSFSVVASGTAPFTYQWKKDGASISGATGASYTISSAQTANAGLYSVTVSNAAGSVTSSAATLTVINPVVITVQPAGKTVNAGAALSLSVTATGTGPLSYQWSKDGVPLAGATSATYSVGAASYANWGGYSVTVSNSVGTVTSALANVLISDRPWLVPVSSSSPSVTLPANLVVPYGGTTTLSAKALNAVAGTYQWKKDGVSIAGASGTLPSSALPISLSLTLSNISDLSTGSYTVSLTNSKGTTTSSAENVMASGVPKFTEYQLLKSDSTSFSSKVSLRTSGSASTVTLATAPNSGKLAVTVYSTGNVTYQWGYQPITAKTPTPIGSLTSATPVGGKFTATLDLNTAPKGKAYLYVLTATNAAGTANTKFMVASFVMASQTLVVVSEPAPTTVPLGQSTTLSVQVAGAPSSYTWYKYTPTGDLEVLPAPSTPVLTINSATAATAGNYLVVATDAQGNAVFSRTVAITVLAPGD